MARERANDREPAKRGSRSAGTKIVGARVISAARVVIKRRKQFCRCLVYLTFTDDRSHVIRVYYNNNNNHNNNHNNNNNHVYIQREIYIFNGNI